jgi:hypothetical protein
MIRLTKISKPRILEQREQEWTAQLREKIAANEPLTRTEKERYRHPSIKEALKQKLTGNVHIVKASFFILIMETLSILRQSLCNQIGL